MNLHLGCGKRFLPGYIHIDLNKFDHIDHNANIYPLPFIESGSVDLIYFSHGIEYFSREEIPKVLKEYKRVLKTGGILRLAVPDFKALAELYLMTGKLDNVIGPLYGHWPLKNKKVLSHKTVYDYISLETVLHDAGFDNVRKWFWNKIFVNELDGFDDYSKAYYPHMNFSGKLLSLNVECTKG